MLLICFEDLKNSCWWDIRWLKNFFSLYVFDDIHLCSCVFFWIRVYIFECVLVVTQCHIFLWVNPPRLQWLNSTILYHGQGLRGHIQKQTVTTGEHKCCMCIKEGQWSRTFSSEPPFFFIFYLFSAGDSSQQEETQKGEIPQTGDSQHSPAQNVLPTSEITEQGNLTTKIIQQPASEVPQQGDLPTDNIQEPVIQQGSLPSSEQPKLDLQTSRKIEIPNNKVRELVTWCAFETLIGLFHLLILFPLICSLVHNEVILFRFNKVPFGKPNFYRGDKIWCDIWPT